MVAAIIAVAIGIELFTGVSQRYKEKSELLVGGSRVIGTVVKKSVTPPGPSEAGGAGTDTYSVSYIFSAASGEQLSGSSDIKYKLWEQLDVGSPIEIVFDPVKPSHNLPVAAELPEMGMAYFGSIVVAGLSFLIIVGLVLPLAERFVSKLFPRHIKSS